MPGAELIPVHVAVVTVSDTRTLETDKSGALIVERLVATGHSLAARRIVPDDVTELRETLTAFIGEPGVDVIITTGGTGITGRDVTPEALAPLVTKSIPGFGELFRLLSFEEIGASTIQSRAEGALCGTTFVFALPGSTGAVSLALDRIVLPQLDSRTGPCNFVDLMPRLRER